MKDGALLFGWGGAKFQEVMTLLTLVMKGASAGANFARGITGGLFLLSMWADPEVFLKNLAEKELKNLISQAIKALIGGVGFGLTDSTNAGIAGVQYELLTLKDTPTKELPGVCKLWGAQC